MREGATAVEFKRLSSDGKAASAMRIEIERSVLQFKAYRDKVILE